MAGVLRQELIRLAHEKPELRQHILPILKSSGFSGLSHINLELFMDYAETVVPWLDQGYVRRFRDAIYAAMSAFQKFQRGGKRFAPQLENAQQDINTVQMVVQMQSRGDRTFASRREVKHLQQMLDQLHLIIGDEAEEAGLPARRAGLRRQAKFKEGEAFMTYMIDRAKNHSKFYEGIILEDGPGFRVHRRWGALTDNPSRRISGSKWDNDPRFWFPSLASAKKNLQSHYAKRLSPRKGYIDVFGSKHVHPKTGQRLALGEYPIGLERSVGHGWGTESASFCIPALHMLVEQVDEARAALRAGDPASALDTTLQAALDAINEVSSEDSGIAGQLRKRISGPLRRVRGEGRFKPDPGNVQLMRALTALRNYTTKQTAYC